MPRLLLAIFLGKRGIQMFVEQVRIFLPSCKLIMDWNNFVRESFVLISCAQMLVSEDA